MLQTQTITVYKYCFKPKQSSSTNIAIRKDAWASGRLCERAANEGLQIHKSSPAQKKQLTDETWSQFEKEEDQTKYLCACYAAHALIIQIQEFLAKAATGIVGPAPGKQVKILKMAFSSQIKNQERAAVVHREIVVPAGWGPG